MRRNFSENEVLLRLLPVLSLGEFYDPEPENPRFLKVLLTALLEKMDFAKEFLEDHSKRLEIDIRKIDPTQRTRHQSIFLDVVKQFGYRDIGVMIVFLLNVLVLKAGEWFLIPANIPHCYI